jgi:hypothetical protein
MKPKILIFALITVVDLVFAGELHGSRGFWTIFGVIAFISTLIWLGNIWNIMFQPWIPSVKHPMITRETPNVVLALFGWILLIIVTLYLVFI